jgi:hypothetical protein
MERPIAVQQLKVMPEKGISWGEMCSLIMDNLPSMWWVDLGPLYREPEK